jgi:hypothetical protein
VLFYLGSHETAFMERTDVPLFVSRRRLARRKRSPRPLGPWALDSGGFSELSIFGGWMTSARQYVAEVQRWHAEMPGLSWAAIMDWMVEPEIVKKTGLSVEEHQRRTIDSLSRLRDMDPAIPWAPVLQGWTLRDYLNHADAYDRAGYDLTREPIVGVGSVCRRQHTQEVETIFGTLAGLRLNLHGFGLKTQGLARSARFLASADSMAWSSHARRRPALPGCTHRSCANCLRYALEWRRNVLRRIEEAPLSLFDRAAA